MPDSVLACLIELEHPINIFKLLNDLEAIAGQITKNKKNLINSLMKLAAAKVLERFQTASLLQKNIPNANQRENIRQKRLLIAVGGKASGFQLQCERLQPARQEFLLVRFHIRQTVSRYSDEIAVVFKRLQPFLMAVGAVDKRFIDDALPCRKAAPILLDLP